MSKEIRQILSTLKLPAFISFMTIMVSYQLVWSQNVKKNTIEIEHPYIIKPFSGAKSAAAYLIIRNHDDEEFNLLQVTTTIGRAMLHETTTTDEGVVKMEHLVRVNIPEGDELIMQPGGIHIMIMGISKPLLVGEEIPATLKFNNEIEIDIEFTVQERKKHSAVGAKSKHAH